MQADKFFASKPIEGSMCESLRLYAVMSAMEFAHLPVEGGIYDQHPNFIDEFIVIAQAKSRFDRKEHAKREREMKAKQGHSRGRVRR